MQLQAREVADADLALAEATEAARAAARDADLVVLPEATYPGYILRSREPFLGPDWYERGRTGFAQIAHEEGVWIAVGLVRTVGTSLRNTAILLDPSGNITSAADKSFLWHFDSDWFESGTLGEVTSMPWGELGMFVCADARMMEIPRRLAVMGARLLVDCTALVLDPSGANAQVEYLLSSRAWENGAFLAVANKCGLEAGIARYAGRSAIYNSAGQRIVEAAPDEPDIISAEIDPLAAPGPPAVRDPNGYPELSSPFESQGIAKVLEKPPPSKPSRIAFLERRDDEDTYRLMKELKADLGFLAGVTNHERVLCPTDSGFSMAGENLESGRVVEIEGVRVGLLVGDRGLVPEEVRVLMLRGASIVMWNSRDITVPEGVARTRADENRIFLITVTSDGTWFVYAPTGTRIASGPQDEMQASLVELPLALAWYKEMAPGTDVVRGRMPSAFIDLA